MKLSEAIRLGAMASKQCYGMYFSRHDNSTCAAGSALLAVGYQYESRNPLSDKIVTDILESKGVPIPKLQAFQCPVCQITKSYSGIVLGPIILIQHLNDTHEWTREEIADWIDTLEIKPESEPEPELAHELVNR